MARRTSATTPSPPSPRAASRCVALFCTLCLVPSVLPADRAVQQSMELTITGCFARWEVHECPQGPSGACRWDVLVMLLCTFGAWQKCVKKGVCTPAGELQVHAQSGHRAQRAAPDHGLPPRLARGVDPAVCTSSSRVVNPHTAGAVTSDITPEFPHGRPPVNAV